MEPETRKQLDTSWRSAVRERGKKRTQAVAAWLQANGDDGVTFLASVAFGNSAISQRKLAMGLLMSLDWAGRAQAGPLGAKALERGGKDATALFEAIAAADNGDPIAAAIRGSMGWTGAADAAKMVERTGDPAILRALAQHWSAAASAAALARLGGDALDPWAGCRLSEDARRGLAFAGVTTAPPPEPPAAAVAWIVASARWPGGRCWHTRLDRDATWAYEGYVDIESEGRSYVCFAYVELYQYYFAFRRDDTSANPKVYEVDHDTTMRGVGWGSLSLMFDSMRYGRRA